MQGRKDRVEFFLLLKEQHPKNSDFFQDAVAKSKDLALIHISCVRFLHLPETISLSSKSVARRSTSEGHCEDLVMLNP